MPYVDCGWDYALERPLECYVPEYHRIRTDTIYEAADGSVERFCDEDEGDLDGYYSTIGRDPVKIDIKAVPIFCYELFELDVQYCDATDVNGVLGLPLEVADPILDGEAFAVLYAPVQGQAVYFTEEQAAGGVETLEIPGVMKAHVEETEVIIDEDEYERNHYNEVYID